jgi:hypothetical protein
MACSTRVDKGVQMEKERLFVFRGLGKELLNQNSPNFEEKEEAEYVLR